MIFQPRFVLTFVLLLLAAPQWVECQESKEGTGSIAGRVTVGGKPARGVVITLKFRSRESERSVLAMMQGPPMFKAVTDDEGKYRFSGLAAGKYEIGPFAPELIHSRNAPPARAAGEFMLAEAEAIDDVDFDLTKGGVITGRVVNVDGRPVIMQAVDVVSAESLGSNRPSYFRMSESQFLTDDRGIYRVFGLPPGTYVVSVGGDSSSVAQQFQGHVKRSPISKTFHPGVAEQTRATRVKVAAGTESSNVDIRLGLTEKTYWASGRVIDAETGKPVPNALTMVGRSTAKPGSETASSVFTSGPPRMGPPSSANGEFRIDGLASGRYLATAVFGVTGASDFYSESTSFEVRHDNVSGIEIRVRRGATLSGVAVIEGSADAVTIAKLSQVQLYVMVGSQDPGTPPSFAQTQVGADGVFQLRGLGPGRAQIVLQDVLTQTGFSIVGIERDGVAVTEGIEVRPGENVTGVRLLLAQASGSIVGQVRIEGALPRGARLMVTARRNVTPAAGDFGDEEETEVDSSGRFVLDALIPGEYELILGESLPAGEGRRGLRSVRQLVIVLADAPTEVLLTFNTEVDKK